MTKEKAAYPVCAWIDEHLAGGRVDVAELLRELSEHVEGCAGCRWRVGQLLLRHFAAHSLRGLPEDASASGPVVER